MPLTFWAPREFFESTYVPHICLVYGTREDIVFRPVNVGGALLFDLPAVPLPMSPRALRQSSPWRDITALVCVALTWYLFDLTLSHLFPAAKSQIFYLGLPLFVLVVLALYGLHRLSLPARRPTFRWIDTDIAERLQITFPDSWEPVLREFEAALQAWRQRPSDQDAQAPQPPMDFDADPPPQDELPESQGNDWDEAKNR